MSGQLKVPSCQWGADGETGEFLWPDLRGVGGWEGGMSELCGVSGWGRGGKPPPPQLPPTHRGAQVPGPNPGDQALSWRPGSAVFGATWLYPLLLFQGPYFPVVPFLAPSVRTSWSVLTQRSSLLFLPIPASPPPHLLLLGDLKQRFYPVFKRSRHSPPQ